jgi:hypothetical protein
VCHATEERNGLALAAVVVRLADARSDERPGFVEFDVDAAGLPPTCNPFLQVVNRRPRVRPPA